MKRTRYIAILLLLCVFLVACTEDDTPRGMINVRDIVHHVIDDIASFTLFIPEGWEGGVSRGMVSAHNVATPGVTVTVMRGNLGGQVRPCAVWENMQAEIMASFDYYSYLFTRNVAEDDQFRIEGFGAFEVHYRATVAGRTHYYAQVIVLRGGSKFVITMTAPQLTEELLADFHIMIENFTFARNAEPPAGMTAISADTSQADPTPGFDMYIPTAWIADVSQGHLLVFPAILDGTNLTVMRAHLGSESLHEYAMIMMEPIFARHDEVQTPFTTTENDATTENGVEETAPPSLIRRQETTLSGQTALRYEYTLTVDGVEYRFAQILAEHNGYVFIITFAGREAGFERNMDNFNNILRYFAFVG
ncbi:MAG: hypothetical protein FWB93_05810 [Oscillospiraceae bacterium]|nr:hypothetical protein [Oscillospiraceae bacterium]